MTRSSKKGPYVDERLLKKIEGKKPSETGVIKTWSRACVISPEMVGLTFSVHNGKDFLSVLVEENIKSMAPNSIVFALANPDPEIDPVVARRYATVVATGRSDHPNQINNVLAFPGIFRGLLDVNAHKITDTMLISAARAIAECVDYTQLNSSYIVPSVFDTRVAKAVADSIKISVNTNTD